MVFDPKKVAKDSLYKYQLFVSAATSPEDLAMRTKKVMDSFTKIHSNKEVSEIMSELTKMSTTRKMPLTKDMKKILSTEKKPAILEAISKSNMVSKPVKDFATDRLKEVAPPKVIEEEPLPGQVTLEAFLKPEDRPKVHKKVVTQPVAKKPAKKVVKKETKKKKPEEKKVEEEKSEDNKSKESKSEE